MKFIHHYMPYFLAAVLPLLTFSWLIPKGVVQVDLWLLWLLAMVVVGLPMLFLELALAKRSNQSVWQGMQILTRESDVPTYWRAFSWLSAFLALVLGAGFIARFSENLALNPDLSLNAPSYAVGFVLTIITLIFALLKQKPLMFGLILIVISRILSLGSSVNFELAMTEVSFGEWSLAVVLALFSMGLGTGLYWFLDYTNPKSDKPKTALFSAVIPIWLAQVALGAVAFALAGSPLTPLAGLVGAIGVLLVASFLFYYAIGQFRVRFGLFLGVGVSVVLALVLSAVPSWILAYVLKIVGLITALSLSVFAGYAMKSSHLRKSLNFKNEFRYNLWRVAVRWLVPLAIVSAFVGLWFR